MAYKIWVAQSSKQLVEIETCLPYYAVCYNTYNVTAYAKVGFSLVNVDEYVDIIADWYGDLGGYMNAIITITPGTSCGTDTMAGTVSCMGEYYSYSGITLLSPDPPESATQIYSIGNTVTGTCSC